MNSLETDYVTYLKEEIDEAIKAMSRQLATYTFPVFYWVNTPQEEQELEWRRVINCLMIAAGADVYGRLPDEPCGCDCCCDC